VTLKEANGLVGKLHRHHGKAIGCRFAVGVEYDGEVVGAAICGRPVARSSDDGWTSEVTRLVTDGTTNACSMLYSACARASKAMGYERVQTYILEDEPGTSLFASGWNLMLSCPNCSAEVIAIGLYSPRRRVECPDCKKSFAMKRGIVKGRSWTCPSRPRKDKHPTADKQRWVKPL